jgi:hypothetical protein
LKHSHAYNEQIYKHYPKNRQIDDNDIEVINRLLDGGCNLNKIVRDYKETTNKVLAKKDVRNNKQINEFNSDSDKNDTDEDFSEIYHKIQSDSSNFIRVDKDKDSTITSVFIALNFQRVWFEKFSNLMQIDATSNFNVEK